MEMHSSLIADQTLGTPIPHRQVLRGQKGQQVPRESVAQRVRKVHRAHKDQKGMRAQRAQKEIKAYPEQIQLSQVLRDQRVIPAKLARKAHRALRDKKVQRVRKAPKDHPAQVSNSKEL